MAIVVQREAGGDPLKLHIRRGWLGYVCRVVGAAVAGELGAENAIQIYHRDTEGTEKRRRDLAWQLRSVVR